MKSHLITMKWIGNFATVALVVFVLALSDWNYWVLLWLVPVIIFIEFGCFAERELHYEYGKGKCCGCHEPRGDV